ncbi:MAG TPA: hypothetical protein VFB73_08235 [Chloroflexota bacterium]|nr:hypothetical protein [Chloroflexota bacterium]
MHLNVVVPARTAAWRLPLLGLLLTSLVLGRADRALAQDALPPPGEPGQSALAVPGPTSPRFDPSEEPAADAATEDAQGLAWSRAGAPGTLQFITHDQWSEQAGCAFWDWAHC